MLDDLDGSNRAPWQVWNHSSAVTSVPQPDGLSLR